MSYKILLWKNKCWESRGSNLGDLAIIKATIENIQAHLPGVEVLLPSDDPEATARQYGIRSEKIGMLSLLRMIRESDLILIGGGTVFTDASSMTIIPVNISVPMLSVMMGKPVAAWGIGSGKKSLLGHGLVRLLMPHFRMISVRDEETREDLSAIYPRAAEIIRVTEDAAFSYRPMAVAGPRENRIVIAPRRIFHYKNSLLPFYLRKKLHLLPKGYYAKLDAFKDVLAELADYAVDKYGARVSFLPMYSAMGENRGMSGYLKSKFSSRDDLMCREILDRMRNRDHGSIFCSDSPEQVLAHLAEARAVVGCPLHSLMLSLLAGTPFIGLSYQQKVARFMRRAGMADYIIHVEDLSCPLDFTEFSGKLDAMLADEDGIAEKLGACRKDIQSKALVPIKMLEQVIHDTKQH